MRERRAGHSNGVGTSRRLGALLLLIAAAAASAEVRSFEQQCDDGDGAACREAGMEELAAARLARAVQRFVRGCELGDANSCEEAAAIFSSFGEAPRAKSFRNRARFLKSGPPDVGPITPPPREPPDGGSAEEQAAMDPTLPLMECDAGDPRGCDLAAAIFMARGQFPRAKSLVNRGRALRLSAPRLSPDSGVRAEEEGRRAADGGLQGEAEARAADAGVRGDGATERAEAAWADEVDGGVRPRSGRDAPGESPARKLTPPPDADVQSSDVRPEDSPDEDLSLENLEPPPTRPSIAKSARSARINECITPEEKQRVREVKAARADPTAFQPSAIWLPPFYMTDAERSYLWAGLLYFEVSDHEAETKTRALPPLFATLCTPEGDTVITPLFGYRRDEAGVAGLALTYFWRRDKLAESDVLFPFFWSLRERDSESDEFDRMSGAIAPIAWWGRDEKAGSHYTFIAPLYWTWGDRKQLTRIFGPYYERQDEEGWSAGFVPLWFGSGSGERRSDFIPPLLFYRATDPESTTVFALQTYYQARKDGFTLASIPFVFAGRDARSHHTIIPPLLTYHAGDETSETTFVGNTYYQSRKDGFSLSVIPFVFLNRSPDSHHTIVPPLFFQWGDPTVTTTLVANTYYRALPDGYDLGVVPFYFRSRKADRAYDVIPPLLMYRSTDADSSTWYWLQTYYQSRKDGFTLASVPFVFTGREGREHYTLIPPLLTYHSGDDEAETTFAVQTYYQSRKDGFTLASFPFLFAGREGADHHTFVPPLFWRWGDANTTTTIAANAFFHSKPDGFDMGLVPLYFGGASGAGRYDLVPPLLLYRASEPDQTTWYALQTYYQARKDGFTLASFPFFFTGREGKEHYTVVPLALTYHAGDGETETTYAINTYYQARQDGYSLGSFPFFFTRKEGAQHYTLIPPLLAYHSGDGETETTFALNTYHQSRKDGFTLASVPFLFTGREGKDHYTVIPPLLTYHSGDGETETTFAVNTYHQSRKDGFTLASVPFLFTGREGREHYTLIPPLLTYHSGDGETETTFAVQTYHQSRKDGFTLASFPLLFAGREGPEHYTFVPPLFWRWGDADVTTTIAANVYYRARANAFDLGVVPFYFRGRDGASHYDYVPPLFWSWGDEKESTLIAGPYFKHTDDEGYLAGVFPFWFGAERGGRRFDLIPPLLLLRARDSDGTSYWAFQTFYAKREDGFTLASIPFVFAGREGARHYTVVPPLYWRWGDAEVTTTIAANVFFRRTEQRYDLGVVPFYFRGREGASHYDVVPPLFWRWGDSEKTTTIAGNVFYRRTPERYDLGVVPLYFRGRAADSYYDFAPPLLWSWGDDKEKTLIAGPYFKHSDEAGMFAGVLPFWLGGERDGRRWDVVPPLLGYRGSDGETTTWFALQTYYQSRKDGFTLASVPFVFAGRDPDSHYTLVPPLFFRWGDKDNLTTIAANVFHRRTPDRSDFGVVPLYFHGEEGASHYTVIPPLLGYHGGDGETETTYAVNTYYQSRKEGFTLAVVPLVFAGREKDAHHTVVPPLFWRFGDAHEGTTIAGPAYYSWKDDNYDLGVIPFYFRGREGKKAYDFIPPLLFYRGSNGVETTTFAVNTYYQSRIHGYTLVSFPFVFAGQQFDEHHFHVPPLFFRWGDAENTTTIAANFFLSTSRNEWDAGFFPFYFGGRDEKDGSYYDLVPPLYMSWGDAKKNTTIAGPYFKREDSEGFVAGLLPLWVGGRHGDDVWDVVPPLFYRHTSKERTRFTLLPLFDYLETKDELQILSPLFVHSRTPTHVRTVALGLYWRFAGPETDAQVLFPFWWDFKSQTTGTRLSTLFPLYWRYEKTDETTHLFLNVMYSSGKTPLGPSWSFHFFPFVDLASYNPDHFLWQVLGGLVGSERQGAMQRYRLAYVWTEPTKR